jgi:tRNA uridine 5-carboxymethylaminomethyl modification enzyme
VKGLSSEARQKLSKVRPASLGDAAQISGVTSADLSILHIWLMRNKLGYSIEASLN